MSLGERERAMDTREVASANEAQASESRDREEEARAAWLVADEYHRQPEHLTWFEELSSNEFHRIPFDENAVKPSTVKSRIRRLAAQVHRKVEFEGSDDNAITFRLAVRPPWWRRGALQSNLRAALLFPLSGTGLLFDALQLSDMVRDAIVGSFVLDFDEVAARMFVLCLTITVSMTLYLIADRRRGHFKKVIFGFGLLYIYMSALLFAAASYHLFISTRYGVFTQLGYAAIVGIAATLGFGLAVISGRSSERYGLIYGLPFFVVFLFQLGLYVLLSFADREKVFGLSFVGNLLLMLVSSLYGLGFLFVRQVQEFVQPFVPNFIDRGPRRLRR